MPQRKSVQWAKVPPFPRNQPDSDKWRNGFHHSRPALNILTFGSLPKGVQMQCQHEMGVWEVVLHWVYKLKWNPEHSLPKFRNSRKKNANIRPLADVILAWLNLCEALHSLGDGAHHSNAGDWFQSLCQEIHQDFWSTWGNEERSICIAGVPRRLACMLQAGHNPFDPEKQPEQWRIAKAAIHRKTTHSSIYKNLLIGRQRSTPKGLATALSALETALKHSKMVELSQDGKLFIQEGRGRTKTEIL